MTSYNDSFEFNNNYSSPLFPLNYFNKNEEDEYNSLYYNGNDYYNNVVIAINEKYDYSTNSEINNKKPNFDFGYSTIHLPCAELNPPKILFGLKKRKKPGKKSEQFEDDSIGKKSYIHTRNKFDNIITKIQVSYINFLVNFINIILDAYNRKDLKFFYLNAKFKKINKIEKRKELKKKSISDIITNDISPKYKTLEKDINLKIYKKIEKDGLNDIIYILNQKFLFFFENIYYKNLRTFNLKDFGLIDLEIKLPNDLELFENLLMKNDKSYKFKEYEIKIKKCVKRHFLGGLEEEEKIDC